MNSVLDRIQELTALLMKFMGSVFSFLVIPACAFFVCRCLCVYYVYIYVCVFVLCVDVFICELVSSSDDNVLGFVYLCS